MSILSFKLPIIFFVIEFLILAGTATFFFFMWLAYKNKDIALILNKDKRFDLKFLNKKVFNKDGGAVIDGKLYLSLADKSLNLTTGNRRLYIYDNGNPMPRIDIMFGENKAMDSKTLLKYINDRNLQDLASESVNPKVVMLILFLSGINVIFMVVVLLKTFGIIGG